MNKRKLMAVLLAATMALTPVSSLAHSGRTDSSGGHKDNKNASGLGYYHYHHGYGAHLHNNGICPYKTVTTSTTTTNTSTTSTATKEDNIKLQNKLNELGYDCGTADGIIGEKTKNAIKAFQKDKGLEVDGIVGPKTKEALGL